MVHFESTSYRQHTSCVSEAQKYQGHLYRDPNAKKTGKGEKRKSGMPGSFPDHQSRAMVPKNAYVEDLPEGADDSQAVAVVDVPPRAPTPPPVQETLPQNVNVFDFLVSEETPNGRRRQVQTPGGAKMLEETRHANGDSQSSQYSNGDGSKYTEYGYSYGNAPVEPTFQRYDSLQNMLDSQASQGAMMPPPPSYVTPGPGSRRAGNERGLKRESSDKKRKRVQIEDLDLSSASKRPTSRGDQVMADAPPPSSTSGRVLHSGLTGGLSKLVTDPEFYGDRIDAGPTPVSPIKRTRRDKDKDREAKDDRRTSSYTSYGTTKTKSSKHDDRDERQNQRSRSKDRETTSRQSKHRRHARSPSSSPDSRHRSNSRRYETRAIEYPTDRPASVQPTASNQLARNYHNKADMFLSFINKGPESERGTSINKALKRYHREQPFTSLEAREEEDKELWKSLRVRRNDRGEFVLFVG